ncbi:MAG: TraB/GumN family protein [Kiloniellaceae bacterium]
MSVRLSGAFTVLRRPWPLVVLAAALLLAGCTPRQPYVLSERPEIPFGQGRIWQGEGDGSETSYVFGTMHVDDKRVMDLPEVVETAFAGVEIAAFEVDMDPDAEEEAFDFERIRLPGDETLEDLIGARSFGILRWHLKRSMQQPKNNVKPWVFWEYMGGGNWGFVNYDDLEPSGHGMELAAWLQDRARKAGKEIVGLETEQEHFDIYDKIPLDQQADLLKLTLDRYAARKPFVPKVQLYLDGDLASFEGLWREYLSWLPPDTAATVDARLIVDRNRIMVERMVPLMERGSTFVAVGAAHMAGDAGVLSLLERRGYTVTSLR